MSRTFRTVNINKLISEIQQSSSFLQSHHTQNNNKCVQRRFETHICHNSPIDNNTSPTTKNEIKNISSHLFDQIESFDTNDEDNMSLLKKMIMSSREHQSLNTDSIHYIKKSNHNIHCTDNDVNDVSISLTSPLDQPIVSDTLRAYLYTHLVARFWYVDREKAWDIDWNSQWTNYKDPKLRSWLKKNDIRISAQDTYRHLRMKRKKTPVYNPHIYKINDDIISCLDKWSAHVLESSTHTQHRDYESTINTQTHTLYNGTSMYKNTALQSYMCVQYEYRCNLSNPIGLNRINFNKYVSCNIDDYWCYYKNDGVRFNLILGYDHVHDIPWSLLMNRAGHMYQIDLVAPNNYYAGSIFDGELYYDEEQSTWQFVVYDVICHATQTLICLTYEQRYNLLKKIFSQEKLTQWHWRNPCVNIQLKPWYSLLDFIKLFVPYTMRMTNYLNDTLSLTDTSKISSMHENHTNLTHVHNSSVEKNTPHTLSPNNLNDVVFTQNTTFDSEEIDDLLAMTLQSNVKYVDESFMSQVDEKKLEQITFTLLPKNHTDGLIIIPRKTHLYAGIQNNFFKWKTDHTLDFRLIVYTHQSVDTNNQTIDVLHVALLPKFSDAWITSFLDQTYDWLSHEPPQHLLNYDMNDNFNYSTTLELDDNVTLSVDTHSYSSREQKHCVLTSKTPVVLHPYVYESINFSTHKSSNSNHVDENTDEGIMEMIFERNEHPQPQLIVYLDESQPFYVNKTEGYDPDHDLQVDPLNSSCNNTDLKTFILSWFKQTLSHRILNDLKYNTSLNTRKENVDTLSKHTHILIDAIVECQLSKQSWDEYSTVADNSKFVKQHSETSVTLHDSRDPLTHNIQNNETSIIEEKLLMNSQYGSISSTTLLRSDKNRPQIYKAQIIKIRTDKNMANTPLTIYTTCRHSLGEESFDIDKLTKTIIRGYMYKELNQRLKKKVRHMQRQSNDRRSTITPLYRTLSCSHLDRDTHGQAKQGQTFVDRAYKKNVRILDNPADISQSQPIQSSHTPLSSSYSSYQGQVPSSPTYHPD